MLTAITVALSEDDIVKSTNKMSYTNARASCHDRGWQMVSIHNDDDQKAADSKCGSDSFCWLGLNCKGRDHGKWRYTDGSKFDYKKWKSGQPNNDGENGAEGTGQDCVQMESKNGGVWSDVACGKKKYALCYKGPNAFCHTESWIVIAGDWSFDKGNCTLQNAQTESENIIWFGSEDGLTPAEHYDFSHFVLEVTLELDAGTTSGGILFRAQEASDVINEGPSYYVAIYPDTDNVIFAAMDDGKTVKETLFTSIDQKSHVLSVHGKGSVYDIYLDNDLRMSVTAKEFRSGSIGLKTEGPATFTSLRYTFWDPDSSANIEYSTDSGYGFLVFVCILSFCISAGILLWTIHYIISKECSFDEEEFLCCSSSLSCFFLCFIGAIALSAHTNSLIGDVESFAEGGGKGMSSYPYTVITSYSNMSWLEAADWCDRRGVYLLSIHSEATNDVASEMCGHNECWIGLNSLSTATKRLEWSDGANWVYTNWRSGEPNKGDADCVAINSAGFWMDASCDANRHALCGEVSIIPTNAPTPNPTDSTESPSVPPTPSPLKGVTNPPTLEPTPNTAPPSVSPTTPTLEPTTPTAEPTLSPTNAARTFADVVGFSLPRVYAIVITPLVLFSIAAYVDSKYRPNDYFEPSYLVHGCLSILDLFSDIVFAVALSYRYHDLAVSVIPWYLPVAAWLWIGIPIFVDALLLGRKTCYGKAKWTNDTGDAEHQMVKKWLEDHSLKLYFLSFITGSSLAAVAVLNSAAFQRRFFNMGLTKATLKKYNKQKLWTVVILENLPQLLIQIGYLSLVGADGIAICSVVFSVFSISATVQTIFTERRLSKKSMASLHFHVSFADSKLYDTLQKLKYRTRKIGDAVAYELELEPEQIDIPFPYRWKFCVNFPANMLLEQAVSKAIEDMNKQKLTKILSMKWELKEADLSQLTVEIIQKPTTDTAEELLAGNRVQIGNGTVGAGNGGEGTADAAPIAGVQKMSDEYHRMVDRVE